MRKRSLKKISELFRKISDRLDSIEDNKEFVEALERQNLYSLEKALIELLSFLRKAEREEKKYIKDRKITDDWQEFFAE